MAAFTSDDQLGGELDFTLVQDAYVTLFYRRLVLTDTTAWLSDHGYQVTVVDAGGWADDADLHHDLARALSFPGYYGANLNALNDCLSDVADGDYGIAPDATGLVLALTGYHTFTGRRPDTAQAVLDIIARQARRAMLFGRRFLCLVQTDDPDAVYQPVGAESISWNPAEFLTESRHRPDRP